MITSPNIKNIPVKNKIPSKTDGRDGSTFIVRDQGSVYIYHKMQKDWFRTKLEKI